MVNAVYDDEKEKLHGKEGSHDDLGVHPEHREAEVDALERGYNAPSASKETAKASDPESLARREASAEAAPKGGSSEATEQSALGEAENQIGSGFKDEKAGGLRKITGRLSRRQKLMGGGVAGILVGGGFGLFTILQGPFQIIQLSNFLSGALFARNDNTGDISVRRLYNRVSGQSEKNNLGANASRLATKNLDELKAVGIEPVFETANGKGRAKIQSFSIDPKTPQGKNMLGRSLVEGADIVDGPNGRKIIHVRGSEGGKVARALADQMVEISGKKGVAAVVAKRRLKKLFGADFHPLNIAKRKLENITDYRKRRRAERAKEAKEGVSSRSTGDAVGSVDEDGNIKPVENDVSSESQNAQDTIDGINSTDDPFEKKSKLKAFRNNPFIKGAATAAAIVSITCAVKDLGNNVSEYKMTNVIKPLIRLTVQYISAGSQVQAMQDINIDEVASVTEALYDEETGTSWAAAAPIKAASGETGGVDIDPAIKSQINSSYNGDKPALFEAIDSIPGLSVACNADDWFGDLPIVKDVGRASNYLLSRLASLTTGKSIEEWMGDLVAVLSGEAVDTLAEGAPLGNLLAYGGVLSANASAVTMGGVKLEPDQVTQWEQYNHSVKQAAQRDKSWAKRMFDLKSYDSLASSVVVRAPNLTNLSTVSGWVQKLPANLFGGMFKSLSSIIVSPASAQTIRGYDYGIPEFGIPLSTLNDERYEDVYENLDRLEDNNFANLKDANSKWGKCFGNLIDDSGNINDKAVEDYEDVLSSDCISSYNNPGFKDYQMYILDNVTIRSIACYEGLDEGACTALGFGGTQSAAPSTAAGQAIVGDIGESSDSVSCALGTTDLGVVDSEYIGKAKKTPGVLKIRLCRLSSIDGVGHNTSGQALTEGAVTNSRVSGAWQALGEQAKKDGVPLYATSSFRLKQPCTGGSNLCATPGHSYHQLGIAMDFMRDIGEIKGSPESCAGRARDPSSASWNWLYKNAERFGIKQYSYEAWHWDPGKDANRCGSNQ